MKNDGSLLTEFEAAILVRMSPQLLRWFITYAPKYKESRKLIAHKDNGLTFFEESELIKFDLYLSQPWPSRSDNDRPPIPQGIEDEIKNESGFRCVICGHQSGVLAHIDPVHNSRNNHPHNLINLCPNCHDLYDNKTLPSHNLLKWPCT